jgi:sugar phosphate isomerase/epimerase
MALGIVLITNRGVTAQPSRGPKLRLGACDWSIGFLLGQGRIDFAAVRKAIDDIGFTGWIQIEGAVPKGAPMFESHIENVRFMRRILS